MSKELPINKQKGFQRYFKERIIRCQNVVNYIYLSIYGVILTKNNEKINIMG